MPGVCEEIPPFVLSAANNTTTLTGVGIYSGSGVTAGQQFNPILSGVGTHTITYTFTGTNGCISSANADITVYPTPSINLGPDRNVLEGEQITLSPALVTGSIVDYSWSPGDYLNNVNISSPVCQPLDDVTYTLQITSVDGCINEDAIFVKVVKDFIVPNTFTPNGDGINDKWYIENLSLYPNHRVEIFNRNGQRLLDSRNYKGDWDGTVKGKPLPSGTYYYIIDLNGARAPKKGFITIIR
jgi:gliding motility-associated-like protein